MNARIKFDWELVLSQMEDGYRKEPNNTRRHVIHSTMLEQLDWERKAYRRELLATARSAASEMDIIWDNDPERDLIFAKHWAAWRREIRSKMRWLDQVEEKLDNAFVRSVLGGSEPSNPA